MMHNSPKEAPFIPGPQQRIRREASGWQACLNLGFTRIKEKTALTRARHKGPLAVQKAFYPEGPQRCHMVILHPPGGVVGGDGLNISVENGNDSQALITTPAAGKMYRSAGPVARQEIHLKLGLGSALEWLPQETIIYDGARIETCLLVELEAKACFIGWDLMCLGLPASNKPFRHGHVVQQMVIKREKNPLLFETLRVSGEDPLLSENWGLANHPVSGLMAATVDHSEILDHVRQGVAQISSSFFAATLFNGLLICRFMGRRVSDGLNCFRRVWEIIRPHLLGSKASAPRIWST
jgi:urease accessory protein